MSYKPDHSIDPDSPAPSRDLDRERQLVSQTRSETILVIESFRASFVGQLRRLRRSFARIARRQMECEHHNRRQRLQMVKFQKKVDGPDGILFRLKSIEDRHADSANALWWIRWSAHLILAIVVGIAWRVRPEWVIAFLHAGGGH